MTDAGLPGRLRAAPVLYTSAAVLDSEPTGYVVVAATDRDAAAAALEAMALRTCENCEHHHRNITLGRHADQCAVHELGDCGDFGWTCGRWAARARLGEGGNRG